MIPAVRRALRLATRDERRGLARATVLGVLAGLAGTALLALSGFLISRAAEAPPVLSLTVAIVGVRGFGVLRAVARYGERLVGHDAALSILARLRGDAFAAVARRPGAAGTAVADGLVADVDRVQDAYLRSLAPLAVAAVVGAVALVVAVVALPVAGGVLAGVLLAGAVLLPVRAATLARAATERRAPLRATLVREIATALDAAPELVVAGLADAQVARIRAAGAELADVDREEGRATAIVGAAATAVGGLGAAAILAVAVPAATSGGLDPVLVGLLALLVLGVGEAVAGVPTAARELQGTAGAVARVEALLGRSTGDGAGDGRTSAGVALGGRATDGAGDGRPPDRAAVGGPPHGGAATADPPVQPASAAPSAVGRPDPADARVRLRGVGVRRGGRTVLRGVDLDLAPGERVALVGPSGSGKSTIGELLVGFLPSDAVSGQATLGGVPLEALAPHALRAAVLHVPQDPYLFDADLRANLLLARPAATDDELAAAVALVGGGPWLAGLRDGLDTRLGERGGHLSGGERQRVGLARVALAREPRLLVLDEPVSHLPPADGLAALRALLAADPTRGALLIAHRAEEAALAGRQVELGADGTVRRARAH